MGNRLGACDVAGELPRETHNAPLHLSAPSPDLWFRPRRLPAAFGKHERAAGATIRAIKGEGISHVLYEWRTSSVTPTGSIS